MNELIKYKPKAQKWHEHVEEQIRSGKSIRIFCEEKKLNRYSFCYWKKKFSESYGKNLKNSSLPNRFIPLTNQTNAKSSCPRILLPNGVAIELADNLESLVVSRLIFGLCGVTHAKS